MAPSRRSIKTTFSSNNNFGASVSKDSKSKAKATPTANPINVVKLGAAPVPAPPALPKTKTTADKGVAITVQPTNVAPAAKDTARAANADTKACAPFVGKSTPVVPTETATGAVSKAILAHTQAQAQGQATSDKPDPTSFTCIGAQVQAHEIEVLEKAVIVEKKQQATALPPSTEGDANANITSSSAATQRTDRPEHEARERDSDSDPDPLLLPLPAVHLPLLPSELEQRDLRAYEHARQRVKRAGEREALVARRAARKGGVGAGDVRSSTMLTSSPSPVSAPSNGGVGTTTSTSTAVCAAPVSTSTSVSVSVSVFSKLGFGFGRKGGSKEGKKSKDEKKEAAAALAQAQTQVKSKSKTIPARPTHMPTHTQGESKILKKLGKGSFNLARDQVGFLNHHDGEEEEDEEDSEDSDGPNSTSTAPRTREVLLSDLVVNRKGMRVRIEDEFEMVPSLRTVIVLDEEDGMLVARDEDDEEGEDEGDEEGDEWECISRDGGERDKEREAPLSYAQVVLGAV